MPPRFSSITRVSTPSFSCSASQLARRRSRATTERQAANGTKLSAISPSTGSRLQQQDGAGADQHGEQHEADHAGVDHRPDALDVEHAAGDQLARVHPVVKAEAQALQLRVVGHAQIVGDALPDRLALVVVPHREQAAQHRRAEQQHRRPPERRARRRLVAAAEQPLGAVDGAAEILRDQQLEGRGHDRGRDRDRHAAR